MCCLYKTKLGTRRTGVNKNVLNNVSFMCLYMCFTSLYHTLTRLAIALNLEGKSCDLNNQSTVGPGAMASRMCQQYTELCCRGGGVNLFFEPLAGSFTHQTLNTNIYDPWLFITEL